MTQTPPPPPPPPPPPSTPNRLVPVAIGGLLALAIGVGYVLTRDGGSAGGTTLAQPGTTVTSAASTTAAPVTTTTPPATTTTAAAPTTTAAATTTTAAATTTTAASTTTTSAPGQLDWNLPGTFGAPSLTSGFLPDPATYPAAAGGPIDAAYIGGGCYGNASAAPDLKLNYSAGVFTLLRIYFIPDDPTRDTTLLVNAPNGTWHCSDDSHGTVHPTVDFTDPQSGQYDIWIGSLHDTIDNGTVYVTEDSSQHP